MHSEFDDPLKDIEQQSKPSSTSGDTQMEELLKRMSELAGLIPKFQKLAEDVAEIKGEASPATVRRTLPEVEELVESPEKEDTQSPPTVGLGAHAAKAQEAQVAAERARMAAEEAQRAAEEAQRAAEEAEVSLAQAEGLLEKAQVEAKERKEKSDNALQVVQESEGQIRGFREQLVVLHNELLQAEAALENFHALPGAEAIIESTQTLIEAKKDEIGALEEKIKAAEERLAKSNEAYKQTQERLNTALAEERKCREEVMRLRGEEVLIVAEVEPEVQIEQEIEAEKLPEIEAETPPSLAEASVVEEDIATKAREEGERLQRELLGEEESFIPIPDLETTEKDDEALHLVEITKAQIKGEEVDSFEFSEDLIQQEDIPESSSDEEEDSSPSRQVRSLPWEQPLSSSPEEPFSVEDESPPADSSYKPAYMELEEETDVPSIASPTRAYREDKEEISPPAEESAQGLPEPADVLWAVAEEYTPDPLEPSASPSSLDVQAARAMTVDSGRRRRGTQKPKFEALPFEILTPKQPLIIANFSPSGGVGKSSLSLNLAALIAAIGSKQAADAQRRGIEMREPRVLAFDGDITAGSLALLLTGEVTPNMHNLQLYLDKRSAELGLDHESRPDEWRTRRRERWPNVYDGRVQGIGEEPMRKFVHWPERMENLNLLAAPEDPKKYYDFASAEYEELLEVCSQFYDVIVIDCGTEQTMESNQTWLRHAHAVFMLVTPAIDRLWNTARSLSFIAGRRPDPTDNSETPRILEPLVTRDRAAIVMTSADADTGLNYTGPELVDRFFKYIDEDKRFYIPDVRDELLKANNSHDFLVLSDNRFAKSIMAIAKYSFDRYGLSSRGALRSGRR